MHLQMTGFDLEQTFCPEYSEPLKPLKKPLMQLLPPQQTSKSSVTSQVAIDHSSTKAIVPFDMGIDGEAFTLFFPLSQILR